MTTQTESLKLALDEIKRVKEICLREVGIGLCNEIVIAKLEEALAQEKALQALHDENERLGLYKDAYAQPEQEPVGYFNANSDGKWEQSDSNDGVPFYAALPPQPKEPAVSETHKQKPAIFLKEWSDWRDMVVVNIMRHGSIDKHLARELSNHFQSMTPQPKEPEQEPVAWMFEFPDKRLAPKFDSAPHGGNWQPLYKGKNT